MKLEKSNHKKNEVYLDYDYKARLKTIEKHIKKY